MTPASQVNTTRLSLLNARSVCNKSAVINDLINGCELDLLALTETWMNELNEQRTVASLLPAGYGITLSNREKKKGGGIALIHRTSIKCKRLKQHKALSFESLQVMVTIRHKTFHLCIVYRPPQLLPTTQFHSEFADFFTHLMCNKNSVVVMGDFNVHWDDASHADTKHLVDLLSTTSAKQHVTVATHSAGHILDLIITRADDPMISSVEPGSLISDHNIVHCKLATQQPPRPTKPMKLRKWRSIQHEAVVDDLVASDLCTSVVAAPPTDEMLHTRYDSTLKAILDVHAPEKNVTLTVRPNCAWINDSILQEKRKRRRLETRWRRTELAVDKQAFTEQRNLVNLQIEKARSAYYEARVTECGNDQKKLFGLVESLLKAPSVNGSDHSSDEFNSFFTQKVLRIHDSLDSTEHSHNQDPVTAVNRFDNFSPVTLEEIIIVVKKSPSKTCPLDPWPTWMVKQHLNSLAPVIQRIVNESLCTGVFPESWKRALIRPLLKKPSLDAMDMKNFRPVANLPFLSKIVEKCVARQLNSFLQEFDLFPQFQSAYRENHSVETALLRVQNDVLSAIDDHKGVLLVLLDLSCAFDTISHTTLLHRLKCRFGLDQRVLQWFDSYLSGRSQRVLHNEQLSKSSVVPHGVPQGSVLGPILFSLYTSPMCQLIEQRGVSLHLYADDTQLYLTFAPRSTVSAASAMEILTQTVDDLRSWMTSNYLKMNGEKTQFLIMTSPTLKTNAQLPALTVGDSTIEPCTSTRNLGAVFSDTASMAAHVQQVCKASFFHLRNISSIRSSLTQSSCERLVHAFVSTRIDSCNSLLINIPAYQLNKLQRIQNAAARVVMKKPKEHSARELLKTLHWLPVKYRIDFKVACLVFKCITGVAPSYLSCFIKPYVNACISELRSAGQRLVCQPSVASRQFGERCFSFYGPKLWNSLPLDIRQCDSYPRFKRLLKTHFYSQFNQMMF